MKTPKTPSRRRFLGHGAQWLVAGTALPLAAPALAALPGARSLSFDHTHTHEQLALVYAMGDSFVTPALTSLNHFLRDHYSGEVGQIDPHEEVGDPTNPVMHERHLEDDVVALRQHVTDPGHPRSERLVRLVLLGHLEHLEALRAVPLEHRRFVVEPLLQQHLSHLTEVARRPRTNATLDLVLQRQVVRAVQPRRDLRRSQQQFRHVVHCDQRVSQTGPKRKL